MIEDPAVIMVDVQNDFCKRWDDDSESYVDDPRNQPTVDAIARFLSRYRESGRVPIFLRAVHHEYTVSREWKRRYADRPHGMSCVAGSEGAKLVPELDVRSTEPVVPKRRFNGFVNTDLELYLSTNDVSHVLFGGFTTGNCVAKTVFGAYDRDYRVTVLSDCVSTYDPGQQTTLRDIESFGDVRQSSDIELEPVEANRVSVEGLY